MKNIHNTTTPIVNIKSATALWVADPLFKQIHDLYGYPPEWERPAGFPSLVQIILEQQVSLASAKAAYNKLHAYLPDITPEHLLSCTEAQLKTCYVSSQKSRYLHALSESVLSGSLPLHSLHQTTGDEAWRQLNAVKGIGPWTASIYLIFCLKHPDIFPPGDVALIRTISELKGDMKSAEATEFSERWSPHRSLGAFYLWHYYLSKRGRKAEF